MKREVRNFLRNLSNCWGIVQRNSSKLGNELINIFRNASIGTTVKFLSRIQTFALSTPNVEINTLDLTAMAPGLFSQSWNFITNVFKQCLDENDEEGPSSDYGSEEIVSPKCETDETPPVTYLPKNTPNGCVSVASDYNYPVNKVHWFNASVFSIAWI
jgi:hypothetical protein